MNRAFRWALVFGLGGSACEGDPASSPRDATPTGRPEVSLPDASPEPPMDAAPTPADVQVPVPDLGAGVDATPVVDAAPVPPDAAVLSAALDAPTYADVAERVTLDASRSTAAVGWLFDLGDGRRDTEPRAEPRLEADWPEPGRYRVEVTALDADGRRAFASVLLNVTRPRVFTPARHGTVLWSEADATGYAVVPDAGTVVRFTRRPESTYGVAEARPVCPDPVYLAAWGARTAVVCRGDETVRTLDGLRVELPWGSRPSAAVALGDRLWVVLSGRGALAAVEPDGALSLFPVGPDDAASFGADLRGVEALADGQLLVTRWRARNDESGLWRFDPVTATFAWVPLTFDPQRSSDTEIGGVPNLLGDVRADPTGVEVAVPSLQANVTDGVFRNGVEQRHDTTVRAIVSFLETAPNLAERFGERKQFDNRGAATAVAYAPRGDYLFVLTSGARTVERMDRLTGSVSGTIPDVGYGATGLALDAAGATLFVNVALSRTVQVYDVRDFRQLPRPIATLPLVEIEPLPAAVLRGKQLFADAFDPRLTADGYIACAHCHPDGEHDGLTWDFTQRGEGLRNTTSLLGRAGTGHGPVHWSANFDEIQDFEHDLRGPFGGRGLLADADFESEGRDTPLGAPKAGLSPDLDALAAYVSSLDLAPRSPWRNADGTLTAAAERGRALFHGPLAETCGPCHGGPNFTRSRLPFDPVNGPELFDVGTLTPGSGQRLGGPLPGLDPPTLLDLWNTAPYLHDGRAGTLREVLVRYNPDGRHGDLSSLAEADLDDLTTYLLSLEGQPDEGPEAP